MNSNLTFALANARSAELHRLVHEAPDRSHGSLADRLRRRRDGVRRARARRRHANRRLRAA